MVGICGGFVLVQGIRGLNALVRQLVSDKIEIERWSVHQKITPVQIQLNGRMTKAIPRNQTNIHTIKERMKGYKNTNNISANTIKWKG